MVQPAFKFSMKLIRTIKNLFPLATRKKIKSHINKFLVPSTQIIPPEIHQEWQNFIHTKSDIINFSLISWDFRFQRPQQLDIELSRLGYRIFYIEHEFISFSKPQDNFAPIQVKKIDNNIYKIIISASRELFIYNDQPSENDKKIILASIKNLINQANIINPIAKIDHPFWSCIADELAMPIIYDCMDNHQGFPESGKDIQQLEKKLVSKSSINLVTSHYLQRQIELLNGQNVHLVKNAADWEHFSNQPKTIPTELKNIPYPIIGYHGGLSDWFDTNILESSLQKFSQCSFVLIGKVENQKLEQLHRKYSNLYLLGEIPYLQVNRYVSQFDVAIIPFKLNELIKAVHPVKIFEYFACGLPVVSTNLPELQE